MAKTKSESISRRGFLEGSLGAAVVAGIGCGTDSKSSEQGSAGQPGATAGTEGGAAATSVAPGASGAPATTVVPGASGAPATAVVTSSGGATPTSVAPGSGGAPTTPTTTPTTGTALVSLVRGTDWVQATIDAIALAGGLPDLTGKVVMLRPNVISSKANYTTSKDVIQGVIRAAKAKNPQKIIVAEDGWNTGGDTIAAMKTLGIYDVCTAEGAEAMDLGKKKFTNRTHPNASAFPSGTDFSDEVYNADYVINIPICKSHSMAKFTMALKAWYGCTKGGRAHGNSWTAPAELHLFKQENFVVLDATKTVITGGPDDGTTVQSKIVVASKDAIATDVTGLCIHKHNGGNVISKVGDVWNNAQIKRAIALQFPGWLSAPTAFEYVQQGVSEHAEIMAYRAV